MKNDKLYQRIKDLAWQAHSQNCNLSRADLAYELKDFGIENDSFYINELVWEAYKLFGHDERIRTAFLNNESKQSLVDQYLVYDIIESERSEDLTSYLYRNLSNGNNALATLEDCIGNCMNDEKMAFSGSVMSAVVGTKGVQNVQREASAVFDRYSKMISAYDMAKTETKTIVNDFVGVRGYVHEIYNRYALALTDVFGDSIKAVAPKLFDYDSIEWLDVEGMIQRTQLEYDCVISKCGELVGKISESFQNSLKMSMANYRMANNKTIGLMMASLNMVDHYMDGIQKTTELKTQLLALKGSVKRDVTHIKADMGRMMVIYKTMNDLYIPRANAFYKYSRQVLDKELEQLLETLYAEPEVARLKGERDRVLEAYKEMERQIADSQNNINYYTIHLQECKALTDSMRAQYQEAKDKKPKKPFLCFGPMKSKYDREVTEWYETCEPVIRKYEDFLVDMRLDSEELERHKKILKESTEHYACLTRQLRDSGRKMMSAIKVDDNVKTTLLKHLEVLVKLLHVGREIMESKLDEKLLRTVEIANFQNYTLPEEVKQGVQNFIVAVKQNLYVDMKQTRDSLERLNVLTSENPQKTENYSEDELRTVSQAQQETVQNLVSLFDSLSRLKMKQYESKMNHDAYDRALRELQLKFRQSFKDIDNRSVILRETLRKLNTGQNHEDLKEALEELSDHDTLKMTEGDWDAFLNGNKVIEL